LTLPVDKAKAAVGNAYRAYYPRLVATVYAATGDDGEAADVVQEAFALALDQPKQFMEVADPQAWLRAVALDVARQRYRRRTIFDRLVCLRRVAAPPDIMLGLSAEQVDVVRALRKLSHPVREVVVLHHMLDMSVASIAEELGVPEDTVKARLVRGRAQLGRLLEPDTTHSTATPPVGPVVAT
jgi:RNA polymerase sigma-70 factor (ECF subfamily)